MPRPDYTREEIIEFQKQYPLKTFIFNQNQILAVMRQMEGRRLAEDAKRQKEAAEKKRAEEDTPRLSQAEARRQKEEAEALIREQAERAKRPQELQEKYCNIFAIAKDILAKDFLGPEAIEETFGSGFVPDAKQIP